MFELARSFVHDSQLTMKRRLSGADLLAVEEAWERHAKELEDEDKEKSSSTSTPAVTTPSTTTATGASSTSVPSDAAGRSRGLSTRSFRTVSLPTA